MSDPSVNVRIPKVPESLSNPILPSDMPPPLVRFDAQEIRWQLAPVVYVDQETWRIVLANRPAEDLFGYNLGELYGRLIHDLVPDSLRDRHAEHTAKFKDEPFQTARPMGQGLIVSGRHRRYGDFPVNVALYRFTHNGRKYVMAEIVDMRIGGHPQPGSFSDSAKLPTVKIPPSVVESKG